jgi:uncharacterized protein (DUF433 family)
VSSTRLTGVCHNKTVALRACLMNYQEIITIEPGKRSGKPCIRGMRITVYDVLSYLASGMTQSEILEDFPYLTATDILACLSYAADREQKTLTLAA